MPVWTLGGRNESLRTTSWKDHGLQLSSIGWGLQSHKLRLLPCCLQLLGWRPSLLLLGSCLIEQMKHNLITPRPRGKAVLKQTWIVTAPRSRISRVYVYIYTHTANKQFHSMTFASANHTKRSWITLKAVHGNFQHQERFWMSEMSFYWPLGMLWPHSVLTWTTLLKWLEIRSVPVPFAAEFPHLPKVLLVWIVLGANQKLVHLLAHFPGLISGQLVVKLLTCWKKTHKVQMKVFGPL